MLVVLAALCAADSGEAVHPLDEGDLGEARQARAEIWTHTEGPPRSIGLNLKLPDGDSEEVAKIVARKKIELAAAELHHTTVKLKQLARQKKRSDDANESDITKHKIAQTALHRANRNLKDANEKVDSLSSLRSNLSIKEEEAKARIDTVSKKKKKAAKAKASIAKAKRMRAQMKLAHAQLSLKRAESKLTDRQEAVKLTTHAENKSRLANVAMRVKYEAALHAHLHAKYMKLKAQGLSELAKADSHKELSKKKQRQGFNDVRSAKEMLKIMESGPGAKQAKKSLGKAQKRYKKAKKTYVAAHKNVGKVKAKVMKTEKDWAKKMAYKAVMKEARLGAAAVKADKAFTSALSEADKQAKRLAAKQTRRELAKARQTADRATANFEHVKFVARQDKKGREEDFKREAAKRKKLEAVKKKRKAEDKLAKAAMKGTGKSPK
jgi:hypothetical protein